MVSKVFDELDAKDFAGHVTRLSEAPRPDVQEIKADPENAPETPEPTGEKKRKESKRRKAISVQLSTRLNGQQTVFTHLAILTTFGLKTFLHKLDIDFGERQDELEKVILELSLVLNHWDQFIQGCGNDVGEVGASMRDTLASIHNVFSACLKTESSRPATAVIRDARRSIAINAKLDGPIGDLAKCMQSYKANKAVMEASKLAAAKGVQDAASTASFEKSANRFEETYSGAFDDYHTWLMFGHNGEPQNLSSMKAALKDVEALQVDMAVAVKQWTAASLSQHWKQMLASVTNSSLFCDIANAVLLRIVTASTCPLMKRILSLDQEALVLKDKGPTIAESEHVDLQKQMVEARAKLAAVADDMFEEANAFGFWVIEIARGSSRILDLVTSRLDAETKAQVSLDAFDPKCLPSKLESDHGAVLAMVSYLAKTVALPLQQVTFDASATDPVDGFSKKLVQFTRAHSLVTSSVSYKLNANVFVCRCR